MNKLIIGCGYLGQRVATCWLQGGHTVHALTRSQQRADEFVAAGIQPTNGDVTEPLPDFPDCETVLYAVGRDRSAANSMREVYVDGLANVLTRLRPTVKRFLYISSTSVYGQSGGEWIDEESECLPATENGAICLEAERIVQQKIPGANVLRLAGIYGPGRLLRRIEAVRHGEPVTGNPDAFLNLIHVDDAVSAILACEDRGRPGRRFLVCDDCPITRREYYTALAHALGATPPPFADGAASTGLNKRCRNTRLHDELRIALQYPTIDEGLPHAIAGSM